MSSDADKAGAAARGWTVRAGDKCNLVGCDKTVAAACLPHEFGGCEQHMAEHERHCIHLGPPLDQPLRAAPLEARIKELEEALLGLLVNLGPQGYIPSAGKPATDRARRALSTTKGADNDAG